MERHHRAGTGTRTLVVLLALVAAATLLVVGRAAVAEPTHVGSPLAHDIPAVTVDNRDLTLPPPAVERRVENVDDRGGPGRSELLSGALLAAMGMVGLPGRARRQTIERVAAASRLAGRPVSTRAPPLAFA